MDEFFEYWELIHEKEKYEKAGKEIVKYKRNISDVDISSRDLPKCVFEFFEHHLIHQPYPTWEILYHIIDIGKPEKNRLLEELVVNVLSTLINIIIEHPDEVDKHDKLYNLLSNIYVSEWCINQIRDLIIPRLFDLKENRGILNNVLYLALLSRPVHILLTHYMDYERRQTIEKCCIKSLFLSTCYEKIHWIDALLDIENDKMISSSLDHKSNDLTQEVIDSHLNDIRSLLRTINDGKILFQLMQNVFTLIFLRFEHVRKTKRKSKNSELNSDSVSNNINSQTTDVSDTTAAEMQLQNGFVCLKLSLSAILNSMRMFLMGLDKMEVYQTCSDQLKKKFAAMLVDVDNALWRLRLIDRVGKRMGKSYPKIKEWLRFYDEKVVNNNNSLDITSDDEKSPKKKMKSQRRKLKKRPKITIVTDENDEASDDPVEYQLTTSEVSKTENSEIRSRFSDLHRKVRSIISKMLMSPESLLSICVLENDHENVQEIIQSYNLTDSEICHEINFMRNFNECKANLHEIVTRYKEFLQRQEKNTEKLTKVEEIRQIAESGFEKAKFLNSMEKFTTNNHLMYSENDEKLLEKVSTQHPCLKVYQSYRINVLPLIDFMISLPCPFELNYNIFKHIMKQWNLEQFKDDNFGFNKFLKNLMDILTIYRNHNIDKTIEELFNDEVFTLSSPTKLKKQLKNRKNVLKFMEMNVERLNNEADIVNVSEKFKNFDCDVDFIGRIASYVRNVKDLMKLQTNKLFTFNELMFLNLDEVVGKLVFNQQCSPEQVENFAYNVNINLVHSMAVTAVGEFQSPIDDGELLYSFLLNETDSSNFIEVAEMSNQSYYDLNNLDILYYIKKEGSFMVAYLMKMIKNVDYKTLRYDEKNFFERLAKIENAEMLKSLFGNSKIVTALNSDHIKLKLLMTKIQKTKDLNEKLKILCSISERQWNRCFVEFNKLKDFYIEMIILNSSNESKREKFKKLEEIESVKKFSEILLKCIGDIDSDEYAEKLLRRSLNPKNSSVLDDSTITELRRWMKKLKIYRKISKIFEEYEPESEVCWSKVKQTADEKPEILINYLLNVNINLSACLEFLHIHPLRYQNDDITKMWVETLNNRKLTDQHETLFKIIETFPKKQVIDFFYFSLNFINHLPSMVRIINFLQSSIDDEVSLINQIRFQKFTISTRIIECLGDNKNGLWRLASRPLIILEQFLMNSKIEALRKVIRELRKLLQNQPSCETCELTSRNMYQVGESLVYDFNAYHDEIFISNECIDLLLKLYTAKALDFQIVDVHSVPPSTEVSSVDSSFGMFQMPKNIPSRDQWIQDSVTSHCMCCKRQKFSLLTRRHHCRRCGRVVCANCSQNRLQFPEVYNELIVRVCIECYQQIDIEKKKKRIEVDLSSADGKIEWKLTGDISADQLIRDDFNFEFSPNVGLCISIINLHSSNDELAQFLLFHCHRLEILLRPIHGGKVNEEIDMSLVAKMLKCLAFAAKIHGA
ncbi:CLUMA_CG015429, isoform A [Clunio marinus]|uniref:CLUMA_CG015429, isoform A n=1 Tax=Clunio marinus TaxID=568069 RepID=A0A1J1IQE5_9DIPT|nr:CLUMA_CG015429, isoform A [Clunio marinus]